VEGLGEREMRVLIVDDSKVCRLLYRKELEQGGYAIEEASDGVEALEIVRHREIDLVLLDIEMPNMNGYQVCERLRSQEFTSHFHKKDTVLPVIFVTSNTRMEDRLEGFNKGATDFINKGFKPGTLLNTVNTILEPPNPMAGVRVLVVDGSKFLRQMVGRYLQDEEITIIEAETGEQAYARLQHRDIHVVITDLDLPDMTGNVLCRMVRRDLGLENIPFVAMIEEKKRDRLMGVFQAGMTDYLVKPFGKEELMARLLACLETIRAFRREIEASEERHKLSRGLAEDQIRIAGMAEIASSVIHNIGNVLNSLCVSCYQLSNEVSNSKVQQLLMAQELLLDHRDNLTDFIENDQRGRHLPEYLAQCGERVRKEQSKLAREIDEISTKVELMKDIIDVQQAQAKGSREWETTRLEDVAVDALRIISSSIEKHQINVIKRFACNKYIKTQRVTLTHIVINLIKNAVEAMRESENGGQLELITGEDKKGHVFLRIRDSGSGIDGAHLTDIFRHGFTTKNDGHGFGLSYCARMIGVLGGDLVVDSQGLGKGAAFEITFAPRHVSENQAAMNQQVGLKGNEHPEKEEKDLSEQYAAQPRTEETTSVNL
jgi:CheY-like chemotaxis protein